jgi:hypothetical protein
MDNSTHFILGTMDCYPFSPITREMTIIIMNE